MIIALQIMEELISGEKKKLIGNPTWGGKKEGGLGGTKQHCERGKEGRVLRREKRKVPRRFQTIINLVHPTF